MSPDFITQVVAEQPQILIVCSKPSLAEPLKVAFTTWQLDVAVVTPSELSPDRLKTAYKIVWVVNRWESDPLQSKTALSPFQSKLSVIFLVVTPVSSNQPVAENWAAIGQEENHHLEQIISAFGKASVIVGQDVLMGSLSNLPVFETMTKAISNQTLIDPNITLYFQTWQSFCQAAAKLIITPHQATYLIQGKKIASSALVKLLQLHLQRFTQQLLPIEQVSLETIELPLPDLVPQLTNEGLDTDEIVRQVAQTIVTNSKQTVQASVTPDLPRPQTVAKRVANQQRLKDKVNTTKKHDLGLSTPPSPALTGVKHIPHHVIPVITPTFIQSATQSPKPQSEAVATAQASDVQPTKPAKSRLAKKETVSAPQQTIEDEVMRLFQDTRSSEKNERVKTVAKTTVKTTKKLLHKRKSFVGGLVFVFLGILVSALIGFFFISSWQVKRNLVATLAAPTPTLPSAATQWWTTITAWQVQAYSQFFEPSHFATTQTAAELTASLAVIHDHTTQLDKLSELAVLQALGRKDGDVIATISDINSQAQSLYELFSQNQAKLKALPTDDLSVEEQTTVSKYESAIIQAKKNLLPTQQLQPLMSSLLGHTSKRTYAVVFQNNQELRPTGGFVQALALITFDQGMLIDSQVFNVYDLDGKMVGAVQPPAEITQLLGEKIWFLRDSNWNPDFPSSAQQMAIFIERTTGRKVDGVVGLNLLVAEDILKAIGPLDLPEYNEVLTDRNLNERMEFHSEIQLVPSASQPDYTTLFLNRLLQKMTQIQADKIPALLTALQSNLDRKQLLLSFIDPNELASVTALGWSGALLNPTCPSQLSDVACTVDTVAQVEANVGINKANVYLDRTITHKVELSPTSAHHLRQIVFTNKATSNAWPKGTYKSFVRLYVPATAELTSISLDGTPLPPTQTIVKTEQDRRVFSFVVDVPIQKSVTVLVDYQVPVTHTSTPFAYALFNQHQPGTIDDAPTIFITPSGGLKPSLIAPQATLQADTIVFEPITTGHSFVGVKF